MGKYWDALTKPEEAAPAGKYAQALGLVPEAKQAAPEAPKQKEPSWWQRNIAGVRQPGDEKTSSVYEQFTDDLTSPTATAAMLGASDAQMGDIVAQSLGDRVIRREKDPNGYEVFVTRGQDGQEQRGYLNKPGLDTQDVWRGFYGSVPYLATGGAIGAATKAAGVTNLGVNALLQGAGAGATSVAGDVAQIPMGSQQFVEGGKAAVATGLGAAGPLVSAGAGELWRRFVTVPSLYDKAAGRLTPKGVEAARSAGLDPDIIEKSAAEEFASAFSRTGDAQAAATQANVKPFGIPVTRGQVTKDPYILTQEEKMRRRLYGEGAQQVITDLDRQQQQAIRGVVLGPSAPGETVPNNIPGMLAPKRAPGAVEADASPQVLGESVRSGAKSAVTRAEAQARSLWKGTGDLAATPEALKTLPDSINAALKDDTALTEFGKKALETLDRFVKGDIPEQGVGDFKIKPGASVDAIRRELGRIVGDAPDGSDKFQAGKIYDAYNDWIETAAKNALLSGDSAAAMKLVKARGFTRELKALIEPKDAAGNRTPAGQRLAKLFDNGKADSGEAVVDAILGSAGSQKPTQGAVGALRNVKQLLDKFATPETASSTWNDIRLAYWSRMVQRKTGDLHGPQAMLSNLKTAFTSQKTIMDTLYSAEEQRQMKRLIGALDVVAFKPPNASGSGYTAAEAMNGAIASVLDTIGLGRVYRASVGKYGIGDSLSTVRAREYATKAAGPARRPNLTPLITGAGSAAPRQGVE